jgi:hypothetical protein
VSAARAAWQTVRGEWDALFSVRPVAAVEKGGRARKSSRARRLSTGVHLHVHLRAQAISRG